MYSSIRTNVSALLLFQRMVQFSYGIFVGRIDVKSSSQLIADQFLHVIGIPKIKHGLLLQEEIRLLRLVDFYFTMNTYK